MAFAPEMFLAMNPTSTVLWMWRGNVQWLKFWENAPESEQPTHVRAVMTRSQHNVISSMSLDAPQRCVCHSAYTHFNVLKMVVMTASHTRAPCRRCKQLAPANLRCSRLPPQSSGYLYRKAFDKRGANFCWLSAERLGTLSCSSARMSPLLCPACRGSRRLRICPASGLLASEIILKTDFSQIPAE